jgi:hypothetical protein
VYVLKINNKIVKKTAKTRSYLLRRFAQLDPTLKTYARESVTAERPELIFYQRELLQPLN